MSDPNLALQGSIVAALKAASSVTALVGMRVYDDIPPEAKRIADTGASFPYVNVGEGHTVGEDTEDCGDASEVFVQIHAWSRKPGFPEVKQIAAAIRTTLKTIPTLSGFTVSVVEYVQTQFLRDPDGLTRHAMVEFRYLITHSS